jgi:hypothetical protein
MPGLEGVFFDVIAEVDVNAPANQTIPEPGSAGLLGLGCAALGAVWRRRRA